MDTFGASNAQHANNKTTTDLERPLANFPPKIWGDRFLLFSLDSRELDAYLKGMEQPKAELRRLITNSTIDSNVKLSLIYFIYRLGLTYLFVEEIDGQLDKLFNEINFQDYHHIDLYTVSIQFQVFRVHGYKMFCDVFTNFMDSSSGKFKKEINTDVKGMLSLFESAQLRIRGESILDEAFAFTKAQLSSIEETLEGSISQQVKHALRRLIHRGMPLAEARLYLLNYKKECSTHDSLLKLASTHFKYLQLQQREELRIVSMWWKDMDFQTITPYVRDRVPEFYLWMSAMFLEPYYSQVRIITTKIVALLLVLDDTCDAYATIEEFRVLTHAINRFKWESSAVDELPEYIKPFYEILLKEYAGLEKELSKEGRENWVNISIQAFQEIARAYLQEAEWRHSREVASFEDYMKIGLTTSGYDLLPKTAMICMGEIITEEVLAWYTSLPKILGASQLISRLHGDVMTFEFERERAISATSIDAYMKTFKVSENIAVDEIMKMVENAWKDINEGCLKPIDVPMDLLNLIVNLTRMIDVVYKYNDGLTFPEKTLEEYITLLFETPIPM